MGDWLQIVVRDVISVTGHSLCVETEAGDIKFIPRKEIDGPDQFAAGQRNRPMRITAFYAKQESIKR